MQSMRSPGEKGELPSGLGKIGGFAKQPLLAARGLIRSEDKGVGLSAEIKSALARASSQTTASAPPP